MKQLVTAARVRAMLADAITQQDAAAALRAHGVRYAYSTEGGLLHIRIPGRTSIIRVYEVSSQRAPIAITSAAPLPRWYRSPVPHGID